MRILLISTSLSIADFTVLALLDFSLIVMVLEPE